MASYFSLYLYILLFVVDNESVVETVWLNFSLKFGPVEYVEVVFNNIKKHNKKNRKIK